MKPATRMGHRFVGALGILIVIAGVALAVAKVEKYPDGSEKARYSVDKDGHPHGKYTEFFPNGKTRIKAVFKHGQWHGKYTEYHPTGKKRIVATYRNGKLHGDYKTYTEKGKPVATRTYKEGTLLFPRSVKEVRKGLARIYGAKIKPPKPKGKPLSFQPMAWADQIHLLKRLRAHRFLLEIPWDVELDFRLAQIAQAGSQLLDEVGELTHTPRRPAGITDELWKWGYRGTSESNISWGVSKTKSVDDFIHDSDADNIDVVGHRRWAFNPAMKATAFGMFGEYQCMYAHDESRKNVDYDMIHYPARGYSPTGYILPEAAWMVGLNPAKYSVSESKLRVRMWRTDGKFRKRETVAIAHPHVDRSTVGVSPVVLFNPTYTAKPGNRYWVEIDGVFDKSGKAVPIAYAVEFIKG